MPNYRKTWHHWLLWWKIDPVELRRQVKGYDTLPRMYSARGLGCLLAMVVGIWQIMIKGRYLWAMSGGWAADRGIGMGGRCHRVLSPGGDVQAVFL